MPDGKIYSAILYLVLVTAQPMISTIAASASNEHTSDTSSSNIQIDSEEVSNGVRFLLTTHHSLEATVTLTCEHLSNLRCPRVLPYTFAVRGPMVRQEVLRFNRIKPGGCTYTWHYYYKDGLASTRPPKNYLYSLPYKPNERHQVSQTYFGAFSHHDLAQHNEYAVDFRMPVGTTICAARPGRIVVVRDEFGPGGNDKRFIDRANYVLVSHDDGTYARYVHLSRALASLGQFVDTGMPIALSGMSGFATEPHLHFEVCRIKDGYESFSLPFDVLTDRGVVHKLQEGEFY